MFGRGRIILISFALIGVTVLFGFWFLSQFEDAINDLSSASLANLPQVRSSQSKEGRATLSSSRFSVVDSVVINVPLAVEPKEQNNDRADARIITEEIASAENYQEAVAIARSRVEKYQLDGEALWVEPISELSSDFPIRISWIMYNESNVDRLFRELTDAKVGGRAEYALGNISKSKVLPTTNSAIWILRGTVAVSLSEPLELEDDALPITSVAEDVLTVANTPNGVMDVRDEPAFEGAVIGQVENGQTFVVLDEKVDWYKVRIDEETPGWIEGAYVVLSAESDE